MLWRRRFKRLVYTLYYYLCNLTRAIACNKDDGWALRSSLSSSDYHPEIKKLIKKVLDRPEILMDKSSNRVDSQIRFQLLRGIGIFKVVSLFFLSSIFSLFG